MHEYKSSGHLGVFCTLTYDDDHMWKTDRGYVTLRKEDLNNFHRLMRQHGLKFKYYSVGEYGTKSNRPHYHCILLGLRYDEDVVKKINKIWKLGLVHVGCVTIKSIQYVTGYVRKKLVGNYDIYKQKEVVPPFSVMSKGLGYSYVLENSKYLDCHTKFNFAGNDVGVPRYYVKKGLVSFKDVDDLRRKLEKEAEKEFVESGLTWREYCRKRKQESLMRESNIICRENLKSKTQGV